MPIDLDFGGVDRPSFDPVPEGDYVLKVESVVEKPSKKDKSKPVLHCVFSVVDGEFDGRKIFHYQGLADDNLPYAKVMLEAILGEPVTGPISEYINEWDDLEDRTFEAFVGQRPDNRDEDRMQNIIKYFRLPFDPE